MSLYQVVAFSGQGSNLKYHFDERGRGQTTGEGFLAKGTPATIFPLVVGSLIEEVHNDPHDVCIIQG